MTGGELDPNRRALLHCLKEGSRMALVAQKHFLKYQEREGCVAFPSLETYFAKRCPVSPPEFEHFEVS